MKGSFNRNPSGFIKFLARGIVVYIILCNLLHGIPTEAST